MNGVDEQSQDNRVSESCGIVDEQHLPIDPPVDEFDRTNGDNHDNLVDDHGVTHYVVNGERQRADQPTLTVEQILRRVGTDAGINVADIGAYYLEHVSDDTEYRNLTDLVTIEDGDEFLAIYTGRTPVASAVARIIQELQDLGVAADELRIHGLGGNQAVVFNYPVEVGQHKGNEYRVGVSFQEAEYPEYPPHFIWVAELQSPALPVHSNSNHNGLEWSAFSVPPSDFWDGLPSADKNMKTYLTKHMRRFWDQV